jgi:hypothetical protein
MNTLLKYSMILITGTILFLTSCTQSSTSTALKDASKRKEIISAVVNDDQASAELIDSLLIKHHGEVMTKMNAMMGGDKGMQGAMMGNMMSMCKSDSSMCKKMMSETMAMCDADAGKCKMMMSSMESHPNVMKSVEGMCEMKGMKMDTKKDDHVQHH